MKYWMGEIFNDKEELMCNFEIAEEVEALQAELEKLKMIQAAESNPLGSDSKNLTDFVRGLEAEIKQGEIREGELKDRLFIASTEINKLREALGHYAHHNSWRRPGASHKANAIVDDDEMVPNYPVYSIGGKRAREALK